MLDNSLIVGSRPHTTVYSIRHQLPSTTLEPEKQGGGGIQFPQSSSNGTRERWLWGFWGRGTKPWPAQREHWQSMKRHGAEILPLRGRQYSWPTRRCDGLWPHRYRPSRERFHNVKNISAFLCSHVVFFLSSSQPLSSLFMDTSSGFSGSGLFQLQRYKVRSEPYGQQNHSRTKASQPRIIYRLVPIIR